MIPLSNFVIIRLEDAEEKSPGGILLVNKEQKTQGRVIACGAGIYQNGVLVPMTVKVGDRVIFSQYARLDAIGERVISVREPEIVAVLR